MITVENLVVKYKDLVAVNDISFKVEEGEIFGVIGPNGAGKTSTIECIEGLRSYQSGKITVCDLDPTDRINLYKLIGVQLQEASFPDEIKVRELCELFSSFFDDPMDYRSLLDSFGLLDRVKTPLNKLSGGQRQKISIVTALIGNPKVLFLDELTTGLDPQARLQMWDIIKALRSEGKTIFMTTHFMEEAENLCDRICIMSQSKISAIGTLPELISNSNIPSKIEFFSKAADVNVIKSIKGVSEVNRSYDTVKIYCNSNNVLKDIVHYLDEHDIDFDDLFCTKPSLEDVFLKTTGYKMED